MHDDGMPAPAPGNASPHGAEPSRATTPTALAPARPRLTAGALGAVAAGGFAGTIARAAITAVYDVAGALPWGTLAANLIGCLALGWLTGWWQSTGRMSETWRLALGGGFLGAFTTFSGVAIALPEATLAQVPPLAGALNFDGGPLAALGWTLAMAALCILAAGTGLALGRRENVPVRHREGR